MKETDTIIRIVNDLSNVNLGMFGIAITVFTVLYAFILSRKDTIRELNDILKSGDDSPVLKQKISFFIGHANQWKKLNWHLKLIIIISFFLYVISLSVKYFLESKVIVYYSWFVMVASTLNIIYITITLTLVLKNYEKAVKI